MDLYDSIFYRKSIKKYSKNKIKQNLLEEVRKIASELDPLDSEIGIEAHIVDRGEKFQLIMGKLFKVKAPHYIIITSEEKEGYLENIGYTIEKLVLEISGLGLGTCWVGAPFEKNLVKEFIELNEDHTPVILVAVGYADEREKIFRASTDEFKRHNLSRIAKNVDRKYKKLLEPVRLAPSTMNSQPWRFYQDKNILHMYRKKNVIKSVSEYMNKIDMGIALRHFDISSKQNNINFKYEKLDAKNRVGKEYYISIVDLKN